MEIFNNIDYLKKLLKTDYSFKGEHYLLELETWNKIYYWKFAKLIYISYN